jgi:enamine deaminase RidA (YjgF/YER057c/UK114 family)
MGFERLVFVSGQAGVDPATGQLAPHRAQTSSV